MCTLLHKNCHHILQCHIIIIYLFLADTVRNFNRYSTAANGLQDTCYDYGSIMHYRGTAFAKESGTRTIYTCNTTAVIGQREGLSATDIARVRQLYNCTVSNFALFAGAKGLPEKNLLQRWSQFLTHQKVFAQWSCMGEILTVKRLAKCTLHEI